MLICNLGLEYVDVSSVDVSWMYMVRISEDIQMTNSVAVAVLHLP